MRNIYHIFILFVGIALASCVYEDFAGCPQDITIAFAVSDFNAQNGMTVRAAPAAPFATNVEKTINNVYVFLFEPGGATLYKKYYFDGTTTPPAGTQWVVDSPVAGQSTVKIGVTPTDAATKDVYVVANCGSVKTALDGVTSLTGLQGVLGTTPNPWEITTPLLMEGSMLGHNFTTDNIADVVQLKRAVAKVVLNISLDPIYQDRDPAAADYTYRYVNFGNQTYVLTRTSVTPAANMATSAWGAAWNTYTAPTGIIGSVGATGAKLTLQTYINEYVTGSTRPAIEIKIPINDNIGTLPPPQFGDGFETYPLQLPAEIKRNTLYYYDLEIAK
ncbi:MAG: fimbrial protein [Bacteroidia bacterium]|nr:fimbrial protein [Bacteroidia bacterium]